MSSKSETEKSKPLDSSPVRPCSNEEEANQELSLKLEEEAGIGTQIDALNSSPTVLMEAVEVLQKEKIVKLSEEVEKNDCNEADNDDSVVVDKEVKKAEGRESLNSDKFIDGKIDTSDNSVLKKLLRGPRYFDLPDSGWGACYNCGEGGHAAMSCKSAKRKKPCFTCGSLEHNAKQCTKGKVCFICQKGGHNAKDCSEKKSSGGAYLSTKICLKCGQSGHEMFSCKAEYSSDDLKEIQCYMCKNYGHLCCAKYTCVSGGKVSCYRCGQSGHTGLACKGLHEEADDVGSSSTCYRCGRGGHFARECTTSAKAHTRFRGEKDEMESPNSCYRCGQNGHFARECTNTATGTRFSGGRNEMMATPSSCYNCGEGGHYARECTGSPMAWLGGEPFEMESISSCYRCGRGGHFACECTSSAKSSSRLPGDPNGTWSTGSCYKCGEGGHFARECTISAKNLKRNRESSTPKFKRSKQKESSGRKSWPRDSGKAHKRKRTQYEGGLSTPSKSKSRGGWITDDPGDWPQQKAKKKGRKSPATPASKHNKVHNINVGGYSSNSRSPRTFRKFQPKNSTNSKFHDDFSTWRRFPQY